MLTQGTKVWVCTALLATVLSSCASTQSAFDNWRTQQRLITAGVSAAVAIFIEHYPQHAERVEEITRKTAYLLSERPRDAQEAPFERAYGAVTAQIDWSILSAAEAEAVRQLLDAAFFIAAEKLQEHDIPLDEVRVWLVDMMLTIADTAQTLIRAQ